MSQFETKTLSTGITVEWIKTDRGTFTCKVKSEKLNNLLNNKL